ncbi:MAG: hypothetical protein ACOZAM_14975 [Pseudomonadota bacterium]
MKAEVIREIAGRHADKSARLGTVRHNNTRQRHESTIFTALRILEQAGFVVLPKEELEAALKPLGVLKVPTKPQGNAGAYSIRFSDLRRAAALLAAITQEGRG